MGTLIDPWSQFHIEFMSWCCAHKLYLKPSSADIKAMDPIMKEDYEYFLNDAAIYDDSDMFEQLGDESVEETEYNY
jgi:hypothetical protein